MITGTVHGAWQARRSEFNHQWLKNRVLSALDATTNVVRGTVEGDESRLLRDVVHVDLREWPRRRIAAERLLDDFVESMSPRVLFDYPPLDAWEAEFRSPCAQLVHDVWLHRHSILNLKDRAVDALNSADDAYRALARMVSGADQNLELEESRRLFHELTTQFRSVAASIEALPSQILLP